MDTTTVDTSAEARAAAFSALEGHPMIMPAVVHAFEVVYAELEALRAKGAELAMPAAVAVPADAGAPVPDAQP